MINLNKKVLGSAVCLALSQTFAVGSVSVVAQMLGMPEIALPPLFYNIVLPVGISFYTFQSMSYSIDLYRRAAPPARSFVDFLCYVSLFPQLIAGPIVRYRSIAEQLVTREVGVHRFAQGLAFFSIEQVRRARKHVAAAVGRNPEVRAAGSPDQDRLFRDRHARAEIRRGT